MMKKTKFRPIKIYKSSGYPESFSRTKLKRSLQHSGLTKKQCEDISDRICQEIHEGEKTRDIYRKALKLINQSSHLAAVHYSLKRALFDLGPSGIILKLLLQSILKNWVMPRVHDNTSGASL